MFKITKIITMLMRFNDYGIDTVANMIEGMSQESRFCKETIGENYIIDNRSLLERQQDQALALCNRGRC